MSRTVIGYTPEGAKVWSANVPAEWIEFGNLGGAALEPRVMPSPDVPRALRSHHRGASEGRPKTVGALRGTGLEP